MMVDTKTDIAIPQMAICFCPLKGKEHLMRACSGCDHNLGLVEQETESGDFGEKYRLACAAPIPRRITVIEG